MNRSIIAVVMGVLAVTSVAALADDETGGTSSGRGLGARAGGGREHPALEKWKAMTPEEREQYKKDHPEQVAKVKAAIAKRRAEKGENGGGAGGGRRRHRDSGSSTSTDQ